MDWTKHLLTDFNTNWQWKSPLDEWMARFTEAKRTQFSITVKVN
jgi:hypothetical protein